MNNAVEIVRRWRKNNPDKYHKALRDRYWRNKNNPRTKLMNRVERMAERNVQVTGVCQVCGAEKYLDRHHPDYSKPLEIQILCRSCHAKIHKKGE